MSENIPYVDLVESLRNTKAQKLGNLVKLEIASDNSINFNFSGFNFPNNIEESLGDCETIGTFSLE